MHLELVVKGTEIIFKPPFYELEAIVKRLILTIVGSAENLPRVEHVLFPDLQGLDMVIPSVLRHDIVVDETREEALRLLRVNVVGPQKYLSATYDKYHTYLDGSASLDVDSFLKSSDQELAMFGKVNSIVLLFLVHVHTLST